MAIFWFLDSHKLEYMKFNLPQIYYTYSATLCTCTLWLWVYECLPFFYKYSCAIVHVLLLLLFRHADTRKSSPGGSPIPVEEPLALLKWRSAVSSASSSSQLGVCMNQLERCIAWEKSPMKVVKYTYTCTCM